MKKLLVAGLLLAGLFASNAQNVASTTTLTSGGNLAGTAGTGSAYYGYQAGKVSTGLNNAFFGNNSGLANTTGTQNLFSGQASGSQNTTGSYNVYLGRIAGNSNTTGSYNTVTGYGAGSNNGCQLAVCTTTGTNNSFYGANSGITTNGGNENAFFGSSTGSKNSSGSNNTYLGFGAGKNNDGSGNVFVGSNAGPSANQLGSTLSNTLFIDNSINTNPLIWGDFAADQLKLNGKVAIGGNSTTAFGTIPTTVGGVNISGYTLFVKGGLLTEEIRVALPTTWADYVFAKDYDLKPLSEVEEFIAQNNHLPNVPSAAQIKEEGINVAQMARIQQEKIEELTLYIIAQNKRIEALEAKMTNK
jgi:hypothetical protein